jgi:hypothetical protein
MTETRKLAGRPLGSRPPPHTVTVGIEQRGTFALRSPTRRSRLATIVCVAPTLEEANAAWDYVLDFDELVELRERYEGAVLVVEKVEEVRPSDG